MIEKAIRGKMRVLTGKGLTSVEDLFTMTPEQLDPVQIRLRKEFNETKGESMLTSTSTAAEAKIKDQFNVVAHIIEVKLLERQKRTAAAERRIERESLLEILADKEAEDTRGLSKKEILKKIEELSD